MQVAQMSGTQSAVGEGSVNFDANVISQAETQNIQAVEATPVSDTATLGNVRELTSEAPKVVIGATAPPVVAQALVHTISPAVYLTINTGLTFLKGMRELKAVDIETDAGVVKFNFYNPFMRADKDRHTGEGLMRKTLGSIAKITHSVLGREAVYIGSAGSDLEEAINSLAQSVRAKLVSQFPCSPEDKLFDVELECHDGNKVLRPVEFQELFAVNSWVSSVTDDEACVTTHTVNFNIALNIGAVYDSTEPHAFVRKTVSFLEGQLATLGLDTVLDHHVCYAFDSASIGDVSVRDALELLLGEDGFSVVSKLGVQNGKESWIPAQAADSLFGYGCDILLMSPSAEIVSEEDGDAE
jgi:hypothetical protein